VFSQLETQKGKPHAPTGDNDAKVRYFCHVCRRLNVDRQNVVVEPTVVEVAAPLCYAHNGTGVMRAVPSSCQCSNCSNYLCAECTVYVDKGWGWGSHNHPPSIKPVWCVSLSCGELIVTVIRSANCSHEHDATLNHMRICIGCSMAMCLAVIIAILVWILVVYSSKFHTGADAPL
jgi:hypothetical protein